MKTTRYTTTSKKVIAIALALVLFTTIFTGCNRTNEEEITTTTTTEVQTTIEVVTEIVTDEDGKTVTNENGEILTTEVTKVVEVTNQSEEETSSNKTTTTTSTTKQTETTTKNTSTGSSNKVTTTTKPVTTTTTTKPTVTECNHTWNLLSYTNGAYVYYCAKCDDYKTEEREMNPDDFMGSKSEYLELLGYVNEARREAGLNELVYLDEFQAGADIRAKELTIKYSHTRPNGNKFYTAYKNEGVTHSLVNENIACSKTTKQVFNAWMNSEGHRENILFKNGKYFVCARCDEYWVMSVACAI